MLVSVFLLLLKCLSLLFLLDFQLVGGGTGAEIVPFSVVGGLIVPLEVLLTCRVGASSRWLHWGCLLCLDNFLGGLSVRTSRGIKDEMSIL